MKHRIDRAYALHRLASWQRKALFVCDFRLIAIYFALLLAWGVVAMFARQWEIPMHESEIADTPAEGVAVNDRKIRLWLTHDETGTALWSDHPRRDKDSGLFYGGDMLPLNGAAEAIPAGACLQVELGIIQ